MFSSVRLIGSTVSSDGLRRESRSMNPSTCLRSGGALWFAVVSLLAPISLGQAPWPPPGYILVDDLFLPGWVLGQTESNYDPNPWPSGVVPWDVDSNVTPTQLAKAVEGLGEWAGVANLTFVPRTTEPNWIRFSAPTQALTSGRPSSPSAT